MKKTALVAITALSLSFGVAACSKKKKEEKPKDPVTENTPADPTKPAAPSAVPVGGGATAGSSDALSLLPADTKGVIGISLKGVQKSKYAPLFKEMMLKQDADGSFKSFVTNCGFDPFTQMDSIVIGVSEMQHGAESGAVVMKGAYGDEAKLTACAQAEAAKKGEKIEVVDHKGKKIYFAPKDPGHAITFTSADTIVVGKLDWVKSLIEGGAPNAKTAPIAAQLAKVDTSKALWLIVTEVPGGGMGGPMAMLKAKPKAFWGSLDFAGGLSANFQFQMENEAEAAKLAAMAGQGAGMLKAFATKLEMAAVGDTFKVEVAMSEQQLEMAVDLAKSMMQRFSGRMGGGAGMPPGMGAPPPGP